MFKAHPKPPKKKKKAKMTGEEFERLMAVKQLPCCVCGKIGVELHHITDTGRHIGRFATIPLCTEHHRTGRISVHGSKRIFEGLFGTQQELLTQTNLLINGE